ncbi:Ribosomal RNA small subunit methyltransferase D [Buchnera aphidicola (Eriosoma grossulariae)]|uniref:16S rRNA (guanine(966)-N(2))-methyltransferase RsmD n=1 Tax=Buchnera aphidicola TaxID=9 RepID=UPI00346452E9
MNSNYGKIRIIGGYLKNSLISICSNNNIRPTTNYMRETLFNWLNQDIQNSKCLDCFTGSGALGIESISRFAKSVTLIDINKKSINQLKKNLIRLKILNYCNVIHDNFFHWLKQNKEKYQIIFIDPPFDQELISKIIFFLETYNCLESQSIIYIEKKNDFNLLNIPKNWHLYKQKNNKKVSYYLYIRR